MNSPLQWPELQRKNAVPVPERLKVGQWLKLGSRAAVLHVAGSVSMQRAPGPEQALTAGTTLEPGDLLSTGRDGFVTVGFADGSRVVMPSNSSAQLMEADGQQTRLTLRSGSIESYVEKQREREFEIRTRSFSLGVKGTHFRARAEGGAEALEVLEGLVRATELDGGRRSVDVGEFEGIPLGAGDGALEVRGLLPPPVLRAPHDRSTVEAQAVAGAAAYRLQLANDSGFLQLAAELRAQRPYFALQTLPEPLGTGFYHTRISAIDAQGVEGRSSEGVTFVAPPQAPTTSEARAAGGGLWDIRWTTRQGQGHTVFELAKTPDFASPLVVTSGAYASGVSVGPLEGPGRYYWRSREQAEGESVLSSEWGGSFEVPPP
ncbi:FecR domain-containing protein [Variovorax sp. JS1663]|uniref:FecR domain-containing protein n=1 Tax=Variovorax sp. JS1663 TaxID=1851577 RepID=UPI001EE0B17D